VPRKFSIPSLSISFPIRRALTAEPLTEFDAAEASADAIETDPPTADLLTPELEVDEPVVVDVEDSIAEPMLIPTEVAPFSTFMEEITEPLEESSPLENPSIDVSEEEEATAGEPMDMDSLPEDEGEEPAAEDRLPAHDFIYVAPSARVAHRGGGAGWLVVTLLLALVLGGIFLLWQYDSRRQPAMNDPRQVAEHYLFALSMGDRTTLQPLATADSRGLFVQGWFTLIQAQLTSEAITEGKTARADTRLVLAPAGEIDLPAELKVAGGKTYQVQMILAWEKDGWHVDQRTFFRNLRIAMKQANPGVALPTWEGISR
jgi:hypothetical protein